MFDPLDSGDPVKAGPYRLRARIGSGGMGQVYLAYTPGGRPVAVKMVRPDLAADREFRRRFQQEVANARQVRGVFTAELVDADPDADPPWLATAYVPGLSLQEAVGTHGPLPTGVVWLLVAGVAEALQAVHAAGIIHRDLKPANVILAEDGPKVIDFGIARASDATQITRTGVHVGSPHYMAPEHVLGRPLTGAADVFCLGGLAVFAAAGAGPFGEGPDAALLYRVVNEPPNLDGLDDDLRELVSACLDKDPDRRPSLTRVIQTCRVASGRTSLRAGAGWLPDPLAREASARLAAIPPREPDEPDTVPAEAVPVAPSGQVRPPARTGRRRWIWPAAAAAGLVVVLAAAASFWLLHRPAQHGTAEASGVSTANQVPATSSSVPTTTTAPSSTTTAPPTTVPTSAPHLAAAPTSAAPDRAPLNAGAGPALLGAPDFNGYCEATNQGPVQLIRNDAYGWHCSADNGTGDDANNVCEWTYHSNQVTNRVQDFYNPNSWQCWRATHQLGALDWGAYCTDLGYPGAYYTGSGDAYGWRCTNDQGYLDSQDACLRLYGSNPPISRFQDFYDPNSWQCWG